jgi:hypothetical protein
VYSHKTKDEEKGRRLNIYFTGKYQEYMVEAGCRRLRPVILAIQEAEISRIAV